MLQDKATFDGTLSKNYFDFKLTVLGAAKFYENLGAQGGELGCWVAGR